MANLEAPSFVAIIGKVRTYTTNDGRTFVSVRPEHIVKIEEKEYRIWVLESARSVWKRLLAMREVLRIPDATAADLVAKGYGKQEAEGMIAALDTYGQPESTVYLKMIQDAVRRLLPDENVDLGLPGDEGSVPKEPEQPKSENGVSDADKEDMVLAYLDELDADTRGVPMDSLIERGAADGLTADEIEEISNGLMDKGMVYEPNLGYLKKI